MAASMQQVVREYLDSDETASLAASSRRRAKYVVKVLESVVGPTTPVARLSRQNVDATVNQWRNRVSVATLNLYRGNLRVYGKWCAERGYTKLDVAGHLKNQKSSPDARKRRPITTDQARMLIKLAYAQHPRTGTTVLLGLICGFRASELCSLRWRDWDRETATLTAWRPKVRSWHSVPLSGQVTQSLDDWLTWWRVHHGEPSPDHYLLPALAYRCGPGSQKMHPEWPLAPTRPQTQLGPRIKGLLRDLGEKDLHGRASHVLRRVAANRIMEAGGTIEDAATLLGHSNPQVTSVYLDRNAARERLAERLRDMEI